MWSLVDVTNTENDGKGVGLQSEHAALVRMERHDAAAQELRKTSFAQDSGNEKK
jgi:hypothetical protein